MGLTTEDSGFDCRQLLDIPLLLSVLTGSGTHAASYQMGNGGSFFGLKLPELEADHSPPTLPDLMKLQSSLSLRNKASYC
jgi:hypothetical protein